MKFIFEIYITLLRFFLYDAFYYLESGLNSHLLNITGQYFDCIVRNSNRLLNGSVSNISKVCHQLWQKTLSDSELIIKLNTRIKEFQHLYNTTEWKSLMFRKRQNYSIITLTQFSREMIVFPSMRTIFSVTVIMTTSP